MSRSKPGLEGSAIVCSIAPVAEKRRIGQRVAPLPPMCTGVLAHTSPPVLAATMPPMVPKAWISPGARKLKCPSWAIVGAARAGAGTASIARPAPARAITRRDITEHRMNS
jgi:hypothetical protein